MLAKVENHREKWEEYVKREAIEMDEFMILEQEIFNAFDEKSMNQSHKDIDNDFADYTEEVYMNREESMSEFDGDEEAVSNVDLDDDIQAESIHETIDQAINTQETHEICVDQPVKPSDLINADKYHESIRLMNDLQLKNNILQSENQLVLEKCKSLETSLFQRDLQMTVLSQENENLKRMLKDYKKQIKAAEILPTRKYLCKLILGTG